MIRSAIVCFLAFGLSVYSFGQSSSMLPQNTFTSLEQALASPDQVHHLDLSHHNLTDFPKEILAFKNLKVLDLSGNYITEIPKDLSKLSNLKEFYLNHNLIAVFPQSVFHLNQLEVLELNGNGTPVIDFLENVNAFKNSFSGHSSQ